MDKKIKDEVIKKYCINSHRLKSEYDKRELIGINFLLGDINSSYVSLTDIKEHILCMDTNHQNYDCLPDEKKKLVKLLLEHEDVIGIVLFTLFQWFGSSVGQDEVGRLLDELRKTPK